MLPSLYIKGPNVLFLFNTALAFKRKKNGILNMVLKAERMTADEDNDGHDNDGVYLENKVDLHHVLI